VQDFNQDIPGEWEIVACKKCGLGRLDPLPDAKDLVSFYDERFYTEKKKRFTGPVEWLRGILGRQRVKLIKDGLPSTPGRFLDFGSGAGHFGSALSELGWEVCNEDISNGRDGKLRMDGDRIQLDYPDGYFDGVSLWYVIEHMLNPTAGLQEINRVLRKNGVLILAQQDFLSIQARFFKENWLILDPPRHIYQFAPSNLVQLADREGFELLKVKRRCIEMGPFTILQSALNMILGNENYLFKFIKAGDLKDGDFDAQTKRKQRVLGMLSVLLSLVVGPLSLVAYYVLLAMGSGDIFTLSLRKR